MQTIRCSHSGSNSKQVKRRGFMAAEVVRSVADIITVLTDQRREGAQCILAAAVAVRDARGRCRKDTLRQLAASWGRIPIRRKEDGKWKDRGLEDVQQDIVKALSRSTNAFMAKEESDCTSEEQDASATVASSSASPGLSTSACSVAQSRLKRQRLSCESEATGNRSREMITQRSEKGAGGASEHGWQPWSVVGRYRVVVPCRLCMESCGYGSMAAICLLCVAC